jgi:hypothetical protein
MKRSIVGIAIAIACVIVCGHTIAGDVSVERSLNEEGMVDSTVVVPGDAPLKETRFTFTGVIEDTQLVTNTDKSIIGVNVKQATKQRAVYFILTDKQKGTQLLTSVNEKVIKALFRANDPTINANFVYVLSITGRICRMGTTSYASHIPSVREFVVYLNVDGAMRLLQAQ